MKYIKMVEDTFIEFPGQDVNYLVDIQGDAVTVSFLLAEGGETKEYLYYIENEEVYALNKHAAALSPGVEKHSYYTSY